MNRIFFLTIVLATTGYAIAIGLQTDYYDPVISFGEGMKPSNYSSHQANMDRLIAQNKKLIDAQKPRHLVDFDAVDDDPNGDEENCWKKTSVETPYVIQTNATTEFVVQSPLNNFVQKIKWTLCSIKNQSCFGSVFRPNNKSNTTKVEAHCGAKYGAVSLYIYDPQYKELRYKMYEVPVACACKFRSKRYGD